MLEVERKVRSLNNKKISLEEKISLLDSKNACLGKYFQITQIDLERKVLLRQLCDVTIRLNNLNRNKRKMKAKARVSSFLSQVEKFSLNSSEPEPGLELRSDEDCDLSLDGSFYTACDTSIDDEDLTEELEDQELQQLRASLEMGGESSVSDSQLECEPGPWSLKPTTESEQRTVQWLRENQSGTIHRVKLTEMDPSRGYNNNIHAEEENYTAIKQKQNPVTENPDFMASIVLGPRPGEKDEEVDPE